MSLLNNNNCSLGGRLDENYSGTDDDGSVYNDGASMTSETSTIHGDAEDGTTGVDESSKIEIFESKLKEALELATQKSAAGRVKALDAICSAFQKRFCPDFIENQQVSSTYYFNLLYVGRYLVYIFIRLRVFRISVGN